MSDIIHHSLLETTNFAIAVGDPVSDIKTKGNVYQVCNRYSHIVEFETPMLFEAIAYLEFLEANLQEQYKAHMANKVETPEV